MTRYADTLLAALPLCRPADTDIDTVYLCAFTLQQSQQIRQRAAVIVADLDKDVVGLCCLCHVGIEFLETAIALNLMPLHVYLYSVHMLRVKYPGSADSGMKYGASPASPFLMTAQQPPRYSAA